MSDSPEARATRALKASDAAKAISGLVLGPIRMREMLVELIAREIREAAKVETERCAKVCDAFRESWVNVEGKNSDGATVCESLAIQIRGTDGR